MIDGNPSSTEMFRQTTRAYRAPFVHNRKLCACGKQITARQLTQYGKCATCVNATPSKG